MFVRVGGRGVFVCSELGVRKCQVSVPMSAGNQATNPESPGSPGGFRAEEEGGRIWILTRLPMDAEWKPECVVRMDIRQAKE